MALNFKCDIEEHCDSMSCHRINEIDETEYIFFENLNIPWEKNYFCVNLEFEAFAKGCLHFIQ